MFSNVIDKLKKKTVSGHRPSLFNHMKIKSTSVCKKYFYNIIKQLLNILKAIVF